MNNPQTPRELINWWLDKINEQDPGCRAEVVDACAADPEARKYYVETAKKSLQEYLEKNTMLYGF